MRKILVAALAAALGAVTAAQSTKCVLCGLVMTLLEQPANGTMPTGPSPDLSCTLFGLCNGSCPLFPGNAWPAASPVWPTDGGVIDQRRRMAFKPLRLRSGKVVREPAAAPADPLAAVRAAPKPSKEEAVAFLRSWEAPAGADFFTIWRAALNFFSSYAADKASAQDASASTARALAAGGTTNGLTPPCNDITNITCDISRVFDHHLPLIDGDNDWFAPPASADAPSLLTSGLRGADWRGRDCNDGDATIYPGRRVNIHGAAVDHNCNGISGGNASIPDFEAAFCSGANAPMGVAILGDSATAHFHLPPQYVNSRTLNFSGILELASNEADWPQCSWSTGFRDTADCPNSYGVPMGSIYQRARTANLCNHRDYQNLGVNGARTSSMAPPGIVNSLARSQVADAPALVFHALIGNDVCNGHPGFAQMTTPAQFQANVLRTLQYLDTVLPAGSHVAFLGLADGRVLWDTTSTQIHPLGMPYPDLYSSLACNGATPCWGWMNANETDRNITTAIAESLTATYSTIIAQNSSSFKNFDMYLLNVNWQALVQDYVNAGGQAMNIIEPVDGFHPSQTGQQLLAEIIWEDLAANKPSWLPTVNPYNSEILAIFGDQGGY